VKGRCAVVAGAVLAMGLTSGWSPAQERRPAPAPGGATPALPSLGPDPVEILRDRLPPGFEGVDRGLPIFRGFPTFPPDVLGYGGYPGGRLPTPFGPGTALRLPVAAEDPAAWPRWFGGDTSGESAGFTASIGLLHALADRVWVRTANERVFVPLAFYDRFRILKDDAEVQVRQRGELLLTFHGDGVLRSFGPVAFRVDRLSEEAISLRIDRLERVWMRARKRPMRIALGAVSLSWAEGEVAAESARGFAVVRNRGPARVEVGYGSIRIPLPPAHSIEVVPDVREPAIRGPDLAVDAGLSVARSGRSVAVTGGRGGGAASWNGARIRVPEGSKLTLDPLAGTIFPDPRLETER
jgi:hypothetical protein